MSAAKPTCNLCSAVSLQQDVVALQAACQTMVSIYSDACRGHGIDPFEMIDAATTKPFGFQPFYPGLGVGGHCIPVNPHYLFVNNKHLPILEHATAIMANRPCKLAHRFHKRVVRTLRSNNSDIWPGTMPRILVVGIGFKNGQADVSGSPAIKFAETMHGLGCARLAFYDPLVTKTPFDWLEKLNEGKWNAAYIDDKFDGIYLCGAQDKVNFSFSKDLKRVVVASYVHV